MTDISITINPAETIAANISPPNSISIGPSTSYPPHGLSHAPGGYDSLSSYYAVTGDLTGYVNKTETGNFITTSQTGQFVSTGSTGQFVTGSVVRPSQTGAFLTTGAADNRYALQSATGDFATNSSVVSLTGNQNVSGIKNFFSRPTVNGTGVLLSGEASTTSASTSISLISSIWS